MSNTPSSFPSPASAVPFLSDLGEDVTTVRVVVPDDAEPTVRRELSPPKLPRSRELSVRYEPQGHISRGGMARVDRVFDRLFLRQVAMKSRRGHGDLLALTRFVEEAQITAQLDHPNIVPVHDMELDHNGLPVHFTMKLVHGKTLLQLFRGYGERLLHGVVLERTLSIFLKVCDAVSFAHSRGVIHRDLKPGNVMVGSHGQVYVMDWGIALLKECQRPSSALAGVRITTGTSNTEASGTLSGTPSYMAPEQAQGRPEDVDERTDVFGLGGILYHLLTLSPPYSGHDVSDELILAMAGRVVEPQQRVPGRMLPPGLCRIAMRALACNPGDRYPTVDALAADVRDFLHGGGWFERRTHAAGELVIREGDSATEAYLILEGECEVLKTIDGIARPVGRLREGEVFGETAILTASPRMASVRARTDVTLMVLTRGAVERELGRTQWLRSLVEALARRFVEHDRELLELRGAPGDSVRP